MVCIRWANGPFLIVAGCISQTDHGYLLGGDAKWSTKVRATFTSFPGSWDNEANAMLCSQLQKWE